MESGSHVQIDRPSEGVLRICLNRTDRHNAIDLAMAQNLREQLRAARSDDTVRSIIVTGAGSEAFCAGFDIHEMSKFNGEEMRDAFISRDPLFLEFATNPLPIIAAINGICYGAGALLALACDLRIVTDRLSFKVTAANYGGANATWTLPRLVGVAKANEILMTGAIVDGRTAAAIGLANECVEPEHLEAAALSLADCIARQPTEGIRGIKQLVNRSCTLSPEAGWRSEHNWMLRQMKNASGGSETFSGFLTGKKDRNNAQD